jgi:hypothetical protein
LDRCKACANDAVTPSNVAIPRQSEPALTDYHCNRGTCRRRSRSSRKHRADGHRPDRVGTSPAVGMGAVGQKSGPAGDPLEFWCGGVRAAAQPNVAKWYNRFGSAISDVFGCLIGHHQLRCRSFLECRVGANR